MASLDWPNLVVGGGIGFVLGFGANVLTWRIALRCERNRSKRMFGRMTGRYVGYRQKENGDEFDYEGKKSQAKIRWIKDNRLNIDVIDPDGQLWSGEITMEGELRGSVGWRYKTLRHAEGTVDRRLQFGVKQCLLIPATSERPDTLCMIGVKDEGFGREIFEKQLG